jgi:hypothetical protein
VRRRLTDLARASLPASEDNVNRSFYKPSEASPNFFVGCCLTCPASTMQPPTRREFGIAAHLQRRTRGLHYNPFNHPLELFGSEPSSPVVIETPEDQTVSESSEVTTKLTANSCITLCSFKKRSQQVIGLQSNPSCRRDARQQSRSSAPGINR